MVSDPVVFENLANQPVDLFYWNGVQRDVDPPCAPRPLFPLLTAQPRHRAQARARSS